MSMPYIYSLTTVVAELQHLSYSRFMDAILDFEKLGPFGEILENQCLDWWLGREAMQAICRNGIDFVLNWS